VGQCKYNVGRSCKIKRKLGPTHKKYRDHYMRHYWRMVENPRMIAESAESGTSDELLREYWGPICDDDSDTGYDYDTIDDYHPCLYCGNERCTCFAADAIDATLTDYDCDMCGQPFRTCACYMILDRQGAYENSGYDLGW
jgi:hypothetical protein